jgi:transketolase
MNGNNLQEVIDTLQLAKQETGKGKPIVIMMRTVMGRGVDFMEGDFNWHGVAPSQEQAQKALAQLPETLGDFHSTQTI